MQENQKTAREHAKDLAKIMQCNCDLDNWQPEDQTGHSWVCRIHKAAMKQWCADQGIKLYGNSYDS